MSVALLSAVDQLGLLRGGRISPLELAEEHLGRIERLNPALNAIVQCDPQDVREQARNAAPGVLHGLPVTIKASIEVAGCKCEVGSTLRRGNTAKKDAEAVRRLRAAGAVVLGITNCPELLMAYETDNLLYGRTKNPWDLDRTPGGSSGGESAAIAAGLSPAGLGSDSGGSVREPAHCAGICSLKPTSGRIPGEGHVPPNVGPFSTLGAIGPMARTIADVHLLFRVTSQERASDTMPLVAEFSRNEAARIRIGWFEDDGLTPVTRETQEALRTAANALRGQGFRVEQVAVPTSFEEARKLWDIFFVQCGEMFYAPEIAGREDELSPVFQDFLKLARSRTPLTAHSLLHAWAEFDLVRERMVREMRECPVLLTPVCSVPAFKHGERAWEIDGKHVEYLDAMRYTQWFNVLGAPAAVIPVGRSADGLPIGVQVASIPGADETVLAVAGALDRIFGYTPPPFAVP